MDLRHLEIFTKVAELKSCSRAAEALFLTQPTISKHVRADHAWAGRKSVALEDECRTRLLACVKLEDLGVSRYVYLVTHRDRSRSPLAQAFVDYVESQLPRRASQDRDG
jgi:DNA-binding transcriptional LysR family regulator